MRTILLTTALVATVFSAPATACSCMAETVDSAIQHYAAVFLGETSSAKVLESSSGDMVLKVTVSNVVYLKGQGETDVEIHSPADSAACGASVRVPASMWFFVDEAGEFTKCGPNMLATDDRSYPLMRQVLDKIIEMKRRQVFELRKQVRSNNP